MFSLKNHVLLLFILSALTSISCKENKSENNQKAEEVSNSWEYSTPEQEGIDPLVLDSIHQDINQGRYGLIDHFLVIKNGKIITDHSYQQNYDSVAQNYDTTLHQYNYDHPDWHPFYKGTKLHTMQSVTKSVTSAALGIAIAEGKVPDVTSKVLPLFDEYEIDTTDQRRSEMTIEDLLTMRSGIEWNEDDYNDPQNSCILLEASQNWVSFVFENPMDTVPGKVFEYNSGASVLLGHLITMGTGMRADEWTQKKLFEPLGIQDYYWKISPSNEVDTEGGLYLTSHDLAKIGYLFMKKGNWNGEQIIPEEWVMNSIAPQVKDTYPEYPGELGYGYQWWIPSHEEGKAIIFAGNGFGGQFLMVAPGYDLIVVFNGWNIHDQPELSSWRALEERILPGLQ